MLAEPIVDRIVALLEERFGLDALLLFGSEARGRTHRESDVDLAALLRRRPSGLEILDGQSDLAAIVGRDVDLIDLATASPILAMQALRTGRCIAGADSPRLLAFRAGLPGRYEDLKRTRAAAEAALVQRLMDARP